MFDSVTVTAAARLHLGFLDLNGGLAAVLAALGSRSTAPRPA